MFVVLFFWSDLPSRDGHVFVDVQYATESVFPHSGSFHSHAVAFHLFCMLVPNFGGISNVRMLESCSRVWATL